MSRVLRGAALVVTDRRWAAPLSAMALGFGLFVGVAIGPGAAGTLATGAAADHRDPELQRGHGRERRRRGRRWARAALAGPAPGGGGGATAHPVHSRAAPCICRARAAPAYLRSGAGAHRARRQGTGRTRDVGNRRPRQPRRRQLRDGALRRRTGRRPRRQAPQAGSEAEESRSVVSPTAPLPRPTTREIGNRLPRHLQRHRHLRSTPTLSPPPTPSPGWAPRSWSRRQPTQPAPRPFSRPSAPT